MTTPLTPQERDPDRLPESRYLLLWLFIRPQKWLEVEAELLTNSNYPSLSLFAWWEISDPTYGRRLLRQNLGINLLIISLLIGLILSLVVPLSVESSIFMRLANAEFILIPAGWVNGLAFGISFALVAALFFSFFHSVALGVAVPTIGIIFFGLAWGLSWDFGAIAVFGFVGGLIGRLALVTAPVTGIPQKSLAVQIATVIIGIVVGFVILLVVTTLPVVFMLGTVEDTGLQFGVVYGLIMGLTTSVVYILINGFQFQFDWGRSRFIFLLFTLGCTLIGTLFGARNLFPATDLVVSIVIGMQTANVAALLFFLSNHFATLLGGPRAGAIAAGVTAGVGGVLAFAFSFNPLSRPGNWGIIFLIGVVSTALGLTSHLWRPLLTYPFALIWNLMLVRQEEQKIDASGQRLCRHTAFWDEHQWLPLIGLDDYLILLLEKAPSLGQQAIEEVVNGHQRWAARAAQIEHDARRLDQLDSLEAIAAHSGLTSDRNVVLQTASLATPIVQAFAGIQRDIAAAFAQSSRYNQKMVLLDAANRTNNLLFELTRSDEMFANRFRPSANRWLQLINQHINQLDAGVKRSEIVNPYVVGVPLTRKQQLFVGRAEISRRLEELLREQDHPPFLLYGQRRMGKTSLLYQLCWLLPGRIVPLTVDLQGPVALARDEAGFLYNFVKQLAASAEKQRIKFSALEREALKGDPFTVFDDWLDRLEQEIVYAGAETVLLCLDEFEALGRAFEHGTLREDAILGMLRHIIQHRPAFKLLLAGSHLFDAFPSWSSYLINVETIKLGCLDAEEARLLIEKPIADFNLAYSAEARERVLSLTNGHPYLLQLLCAEIVNAKNEGPEESRFVVGNRAEVEQVIPQVLQRGRQFFVDMEQNQFPAGSLPLLQEIAAEPSGLSIDAISKMAVEQAELDRLLVQGHIEKREGRLLLPIELIRMWLLQN